jgi:hypothetical protein
MNLVYCARKRLKGVDISGGLNFLLLIIEKRGFLGFLNKYNTHDKSHGYTTS